MFSQPFLLFPLSYAASFTAAALDPSCAPGGNFDLSKWTLQLPNASTSNPSSPAQISPAQLKGCNGYEDFKIFFTESGDGAMAMKVPGDTTTSDCVSFSGSETRCRTEFKETSPASWSTSASKNRLSMTLLATDGSEIVIGQAFQAETQYSKPIAEIYYRSDGSISVGVEDRPSGGSQTPYQVGKVTFGTKFSYELRYEGGKLGIAINGGAVQNLPLGFATAKALFKAGNYNQGSDRTDIHVFALSTTHAA